MFSPAGCEIGCRDFQFLGRSPQVLQRDLDVVVLCEAGADFFDVGERMRERAIGRGQTGEVFAERLELGESEIQFGVFVGEFIEILGGVLKVFHRVGRFVGNRFDDLQHFRCCLAEIGCAFACERVALFCAAGLLCALSEIDCHVA